LAKTQAGLNLQEIVLSAEWWHSIEIPDMPGIVALLSYAKERINQGFPQNFFPYCHEW
jgi:hypothetical protein